MFVDGKFEDDFRDQKCFRFTRHAETRLRQRGIRRDDLKTLLSVGDEAGSRVVLSAADIADEIAEHKRAIASLQRLHGKVAVVEGGHLVTVYAETNAGHRANKRRNCL